MRILLLNQAFYPDVVSTAQHLADLAVGLAERGHEVTVVTGARAYDEPGRRYPKRESWQGVEVIRVGSTGLGKGRAWRRVMDGLSFLGLCALRLVWLPRPEVVVALTSPPLIGLVGALAAWVWRSRFVYWVMDLNPDEAVAAGWLRRGSVAERALEGLSRFTLRRAERVVVLDRFMEQRLLAKGVPAGKVRVLPPWSHDEQVRFDPAGRERFRRAHGLEGKFVMMYAGNHSPCHPLETLVAAARRLAGARLLAAESGLAFCFMGGGSEWRRLKGEFETMGAPGDGTTGRAESAEQVLFVPYQPLSELAGALSAADLHVVVMGDGLVGIVHPCKVYNILRVGAPVLYIGPAQSHLGDLGRDAGGGWFGVRHGDVEGAVAAIVRARAQAARRTMREVCGRFAKAKLLPRMIEEISAGRDDERTGANEEVEDEVGTFNFQVGGAECRQTSER